MLITQYQVNTMAAHPEFISRSDLEVTDTLVGNFHTYPFEVIIVCNAFIATRQHFYKLAGGAVTVAFRHADMLVEITYRQTAVSPIATVSCHAAKVLVIEF